MSYKSNFLQHNLTFGALSDIVPSMRACACVYLTATSAFYVPRLYRNLIQR